MPKSKGHQLPPEPVDNKIEFTSENVHAVFCIMLKFLGGGIAVPGEPLRNFPKETKWQAVYDEVNDVWFVKLPRKRKRGILTPSQRIVTPLGG